MTDATEAARALAARRPRTTYQCEACGQPFEAWAVRPGKQQPRSCSNKCRQQKFRSGKKARAE